MMMCILASRSFRHFGAIPEANLLPRTSQELQRSQPSRGSLIPETSALDKTTTATHHPWSSPSITQWQLFIPDFHLQLRILIFLHIITWNALQPGQLWIKTVSRHAIQQSSVKYHSRYNKSTCADHAVTRIMLVPFTPFHADRIKTNRPSPPTRGEALFHFYEKKLALWF